jgi:hypothetical protein
MKTFRNIIVILFFVAASFFLYRVYFKFVQENAILKQVIERLEAESRVAEVLVTGVNFDEERQKNFTTIKFLEYDTKGNPLEPKYFTFSGNIIQFQSLVIRFDDVHVRGGDRLKGKSAFIFWKAFMLDGPNTQEYEITQMNTVPEGYKVPGLINPFEEKLWQEFWESALNEEQAQKQGIKNAQIEAPGTMFVPGKLYTIIIEHDGGLRIDSKDLPPILKGEAIP